VNTFVEPTRIEQITDYDLLNLEIWTNGATLPGEALSEAARILLQHFAPLAELSATLEGALEGEEELLEPAARFNDVAIEELDLTMRAYNCLKRAGIAKVGEILERLERGPQDILAIRNFGQKSLAELVGKMEAKGFLAEGYLD